MSRICSIALIWLLLFLPSVLHAEGFWASLLPFFQSPPLLDRNGDQSVRVVLVSPKIHAGNIHAAEIVSDLESILKCATDLPVRVSMEMIDPFRSLMGWWYAATAGERRKQLFSSRPDLLLLAEEESFVNRYPEFFFEGVRVLSESAKAVSIPTGLLLLSRPGISHRDKQVDMTASITYRVGNGCGVSVIPAGYGWERVLFHNRLPGDFQAKSRVNAFLAAAAVYAQWTDRDIPSDALVTFWTTRKIAGDLALSASEAVRNERTRSHYTRPFQGRIQKHNRIGSEWKIYLPTAPEKDHLFPHLQRIAASANLPLYARSPEDEYTNGMNRFSVPFDLVYGDQQQIENYTVTNLSLRAPTNFIPPCITLYSRLPEGIADNEILERLEPMLLAGYDRAKERNVCYIPYPLAWARFLSTHKSSPLIREESVLQYLLAGMIYATVSGRCAYPTQSPLSNITAYADAAITGFKTISELATLSLNGQGILLRGNTPSVLANHSTSISLRLLTKPSSLVMIHCATDKPNATTLSQNLLTFTPENFDKEQTITMNADPKQRPLRMRFMASAHSEDPAANRLSDFRILTLNHPPKASTTFLLSTSVFDPKEKTIPLLQPQTPPVVPLEVELYQHGIRTDLLFFAPDAASAQVLPIHPTLEDYQKGACTITLQSHSDDPAYQKSEQTFTIRLNRGNAPLPAIQLNTSAGNAPVKGPAFVSASAQVQALQPISSLRLFYLNKCVAASTNNFCTGQIENGPPQSRLATGTYPVWAEVVLQDSSRLATRPITIQIE